MDCVMKNLENEETISEESDGTTEGIIFDQLNGLDSIFVGPALLTFLIDNKVKAFPIVELTIAHEDNIPSFHTLYTLSDLSFLASSTSSGIENFVEIIYKSQIEIVDDLETLKRVKKHLDRTQDSCTRSLELIEQMLASSKSRESED